MLGTVSHGSVSGNGEDWELSAMAMLDWKLGNTGSREKNMLTSFLTPEGLNFLSFVKMF